MTGSSWGSSGAWDWQADMARALAERGCADQTEWIARYPGEHCWFLFRNDGVRSCAMCGVVQRGDGKNSPCRGLVKIALRHVRSPNFATGADDPRLAETSWPLPTTDFEAAADALVHGEPTREQLMFCASVMSAYSDLVTCTGEKRRRIGAALNKVTKARRS